MDLVKYLTATFHFNDKANRQLIAKISTIENNEEIVRHLSHLVNSQYKWMARIMQDPGAPQMDWWLPVYSIAELEEKWDHSLTLWLNYISARTEEELLTEVRFTGFDGSPYAATPADIALQLNYHSIHHRAQIQLMIRQSGHTPDFIDYIGTKYRKLS